MNTSLVSPQLLAASYKNSIEIMQNRAKSFYQAFSVLPYDRFCGVAAIYAFCRYADDLVDGSDPSNSQEVLKELQALERYIHSLYINSETFLSEHTRSNLDLPWCLAFEDTINRFKIPKESFLLQIEGQRKDLFFQDIQTIDELIDYCKKVAGSVGTMLLPLLAAEEADTSDSSFVSACENLGIAMQITNILRDVGEDLKMRNRVYIPFESLQKNGIDRKDLVSLSKGSSSVEVIPQIPDGFIRIWEDLSLIADQYYENYKQKVDFFHRDAKVSVVAAAMSYHAIADAVREAFYDCFTKRCYTSDETRKALILKAYEFVQKGDKV